MSASAVMAVAAAAVYMLMGPASRRSRLGGLRAGATVSLARKLFALGAGPNTTPLVVSITTSFPTVFVCVAAAFVYGIAVLFLAINSRTFIGKVRLTVIHPPPRKTQTLI